MIDFGHINENHNFIKAILLGGFFTFYGPDLLFFIKKVYNISKGQKRSKECFLWILILLRKSTTAIMNAQSIAVREQHQEVDESHFISRSLKILAV